ncbi:MAG: hypothetical protein ACJAZO_004230 [Myxococcota bacterium]|jgi:hypothetical protein
MESEAISDTLEELSNADLARKRGKDIHTLRGIRGTPDGEVARIAASTWLDDKPVWPQDVQELTELFNTAFEDGLVAISLLAALLPDHPAAVYDLGLDWLDRVDDVLTADALGSVILGPGLLATGGLADLLSVAKAAARPEARRAAVIAALPATSTVVTGPAMSALRQRTNERTLRFVEEPRNDVVSQILTAFIRDPHPAVHKGIRRVLRAWKKIDKQAATDWANGVAGGIPKTLRAELGGTKKKR